MKSENLQNVAKLLVELAWDEGSTDNITVQAVALKRITPSKK